ncbi:MAG: YihA family ribosome biogenesis GTP-binding protein, partial [Lachnospiraceae bacterium]|nr:YihA family ribosome biogenesis GTP-binding protein [Lachnospiraceae bacterium]
MIIRSVNLETVVGVTSTLPVHEVPEIAFAGRSNVGKSSLLNALVGRKKLARTSSEPGKTQTINFYNVNGECYFVDLPGYGYARTSKETREKWGRMIGKYLKTSKALSAIVVLVDMRHEPTKDDMAMIEWVKASEVPLITVLTK